VGRHEARARHRYDAYILADHGQSASIPYSDLSRGKRLERWIFDGFLNPERAGDPDAARVGLWQGLRERQAETKGMIQRFMNYLDEDYLRPPATTPLSRRPFGLNIPESFFCAPTRSSNEMVSPQISLGLQSGHSPKP
jgi:hypothetical protein